MFTEKELGTATLLMLNILIYTISVFTMGFTQFLLQSTIIAFYCFACMVYLYLILKREKNYMLPFLLFIMMFVNAFLIANQLLLSLLILTSSITGLIALSIKFYHRNKTKSRKKIIERELDDFWKQEPHVLYDEYDLEKF